VCPACSPTTSIAWARSGSRRLTTSRHTWAIAWPTWPWPTRHRPPTTPWNRPRAIPSAGGPRRQVACISRATRPCNTLPRVRRARCRCSMTSWHRIPPTRSTDGSRAAWSILPSSATASGCAPTVWQPFRTASTVRATPSTTGGHTSSLCSIWKTTSVSRSASRARPRRPSPCSRATFMTPTATR